MRNSFLLIIILIALICVVYLFKNSHVNFTERDIRLKFMNSDDPSIDPKIIELYQSQIEDRKQMLKGVPDQQDYFILYNALVPEVYCKNLVRIGYIGDGGKWICDPTAITKKDTPCTLYSLGINNNPSFEEDFQTFVENKCVVRSIDKDDQKDTTIERINQSNGVFMKAFVTSKTNKLKDEYSFKDILNHFNDDRVDILKIDIEGAEFLILDQILSVPICQILIELHGKSARKTLDFLTALSEKGFYLFSYEINGAYHQLSEYSLIHESCLKDFNVDTVFGKYLS